MTNDDAVRQQHTLQTLVRLSETEAYCDITFFNREPLLGVRLSPKLGSALMYGAGAAKIASILSALETRTGLSFNAGDVWVIVEFGNRLPSAEELANVDLADGEAEIAPCTASFCEIPRTGG
ncbi:transposase [Pseudomonas sp. PNP]|uniref:transposase n=1 Tax=Pseudomonas sp. PNP TaxID=361819 RepID=UPI001AECADAE|nr:transposase [Pseudomonas sp. PNP]MBP2842373.1 transposase [Pseudomonas sp. PNP]